MPDHSDACANALEFEVFVARGARQGRLNLMKLLEPFAGLAAHYDQDIANPRRLDLKHFTAALANLPTVFAHIKSVQVVANLAAFHVDPVDSSAPWPAALLNEDILFLACPQGLASLRALAVALCTIIHEGGKWRQLLTNHPALRRSLLDGETSALPEVAVLLGQDCAAVQHALHKTQGTLWMHLDREPLRHIDVHAALHPGHAAAQAPRRVDGILAALTELGLGRRPLHLWVGSSIVTESVSPYCRDLGAQLVAWGQNEGLVAKPHTAADTDVDVIVNANANVNVKIDVDTGTHTASAERTDVAYAVLPQFLATDVKLWAEKAVVEQSVGLQRREVEGIHFEIIDLGRLNPALCDSRLQIPQSFHLAAPILLRLDADAGDVTGRILPHLLAALSPQLHSITVITPGKLPAAHPGQIGIPRTLQLWHGGLHGHLATAADELTSKTIMAEGGRMVDVMSIIDAPFCAQGAPHTWLPSDTEHRRGVTFGQVMVLTAIQDYQLKRRQKEPLPLSWAVVHEGTSQAQPNLRYIRGQAVVARAGLRRIFSSTLTPPAATEATAPVKTEPHSSPSSKRGRRIRA